VDEGACEFHSVAKTWVRRLRGHMRPPRRRHVRHPRHVCRLFRRQRLQ